MTWTEEERKRTVEILTEEAVKYRAERKMSKYLETRAKIKAWSTSNLCKDFSERCVVKGSLIDCIVTHFPDKKDRSRCPVSRLVDWSEEQEESPDESSR